MMFLEFTSASEVKQEELTENASNEDWDQKAA